MKAKTTLKKSVKLVAAMMMAIAPNCAFAQFNSTTYFMDDVNFKQRLNPAEAKSLERAMLKRLFSLS